MKRLLSLLAVMALVLGTTGTGLAKTKITFAMSNIPTAPAFVSTQTVVDAYNASQSEIEVELVSLKATGGNPWENLINMVVTGEVPDVVQMSQRQIGEFANSELIQPLDDLIKKSSLDPADYWLPMYNAGRYKGKQWAIPVSGTMQLMYGNKQLLQESGIVDYPKTIEELDALAPKLSHTDSEGNFTQIGFMPWWGMGRNLAAWSYGFGGELYNESTGKLTLTHKGNLAALNWYAQYADRYPDFKNTGADYGVDRFNSTRDVAFVIQGSWWVTNYPEYFPDLEFVAFKPPSAQGFPPATLAGGQMMVLPTGVKNPDAAWKFIEFMTTAPGQKLRATDRFDGPPINIDTVKLTLQQSINKFGPGVTEAIELMEYAHVMPTLPISGQLENTVSSIWQKVIWDGEVPANVLEAAQQELQALLDEAEGK